MTYEQAVRKITGTYGSCPVEFTEEAGRALKEPLLQYGAAGKPSPPAGLCRLHLCTAGDVFWHAQGGGTAVGEPARPYGNQPEVLCKRRARGQGGEKGLPVFYSFRLPKPPDG